jgi:predicted O-methyltransferase YrrM
MGTQSFRAISYVRYLATAKSIQYIHSPFLFELMKYVFDDSKKNYPSSFNEIEECRKKLTGDKRIIQFEDHGAGANGDEKSIKEISVSDIASKAVKQGKYSRFLYRLVDYLKCTEAIELGTSLGITTSYLASACNQVKTVEADKNVLNIAEENWKILSKRNIKSYCFDLNEGWTHLTTDIDTIDFLFIDANHRKEAVIRYVLQALPYIHQKSIIVLDDIYWSEDMLEAWNILKARKEVSLSFDIFQMGVLFFDSNLSKQHFTLKY